MNNIGIYVLFWSLFSYQVVNAQNAIPNGYQLVWQDEFDSGTKPTADFWSYESGFVRNNELQWYKDDNAFIENGLLIFEGRREKINNDKHDPESNDWRRKRPFAEYSSSSINTRGKYSFQYGILEVRAKIDTSMGMWPAIWTLGITRPWPANGEVDVMEFYRRRGIPIILANGAWAEEKNKAKWDESVIPLKELLANQEDWSERFHIWKMDWTKDRIRLYLDDLLLNEIDLSNTLNPDGFNPFHQEHYILLNLAIGSNGDDPSNTIFPKRYLVDYVRVYQER
ncbi:MAG: family 16 glycosylhydrolase [Bacteroidota bacterium]